MIDYKLTTEAIAMIQGSSKGTQPKYYDQGFWYKVNRVGYEGLSERLVSTVLKHSNVQNFVEYEQCTINGRAGCRSGNFLHEGESFISFQRLYELYTGENLQGKMVMFSGVEDRMDFVKDFIESHTGFDCSKYLSEILTLDMLTLNTDRHFNNLGLIVNTDRDLYSAAPIFDNGNSLLSDWEKFSEDTLEENIDLARSQPFSSSFGMQAKCAGFGLALDYEALMVELSHEPDSRALQVLTYQLERCRNMIPDLRMVRDHNEPDIVAERKNGGLRILEFSGAISAEDAAHIVNEYKKQTLCLSEDSHAFFVGDRDICGRLCGEFGGEVHGCGDMTVWNSVTEIRPDEVENYAAYMTRGLDLER